MTPLLTPSDSHFISKANPQSPPSIRTSITPSLFTLALNLLINDDPKLHDLRTAYAPAVTNFNRSQEKCRGDTYMSAHVVSRLRQLREMGVHLLLSDLQLGVESEWALVPLCKDWYNTNVEEVDIPNELAAWNHYDRPAIISTTTLDDMIEKAKSVEEREQVVLVGLMVTLNVLAHLLWRFLEHPVEPDTATPPQFKAKLDSKVSLVQGEKERSVEMRILESLIALDLSKLASLAVIATPLHKWEEVPDEEFTEAEKKSQQDFYERARRMQMQLLKYIHACIVSPFHELECTMRGGKLFATR